MSVHIHVIVPVVPTGLTDPALYDGILDPDDTISITELETGPTSIESAYDSVLAAPDTVAKAMEAERAGADAIVIDCMGDPALIAARQCLSIPVLGPCQTAMTVACTLGHRFSVLSISQSTHAAFRRRAIEYGVETKYASTRSVEMPVADLAAQKGLLRERLHVAALDAIEKDEADTLVIGCTRMGIHEYLQEDLLARGITVPIIDPTPTTIRYAKLMVGLGVSQSVLAYPKPK